MAPPGGHSYGLPPIPVDAMGIPMTFEARMAREVAAVRAGAAHAAHWAAAGARADQGRWGPCRALKGAWECQEHHEYEPVRPPPVSLYDWPFPVQAGRIASRRQESGRHALLWRIRTTCGCAGETGAGLPAPCLSMHAQPAASAGAVRFQDESASLVRQCANGRNKFVTVASGRPTGGLSPLAAGLGITTPPITADSEPPNAPRNDADSECKLTFARAGLTEGPDDKEGAC